MIDSLFVVLGALVAVMGTVNAARAEEVKDRWAFTAVAVGALLIALFTAHGSYGLGR